MNAPCSGCPINLTLEALGDRWSLIVIRDLMFGNRRHFRELLTGQRGRGIGKALVSEAIAQARTVQGIERLLLAGITTNTSARQLYRSLGFQVYGPGAARSEARRAGVEPLEAIGEPVSGDWQSEEVCSANTPDVLAAVANALEQVRRGGPRWTIEESLANALARAKAQGNVS